MNIRISMCLATWALAAMAVGQTTLPATRPATVGTVAAAAKDAVPLGPGCSIPKATLKTADDKPFDLQAAVAAKPTILVFYRGSWCPICMRHLRGLQSVAEELQAAGYQLLAISPDKPADLATTAETYQLTIPLLSDADASVIKAFGLAFQAPASQFKMLEEHSGADHHALPIPALYILGTDGTVRFAHFDPDYKKRMTPSEVVEQAQKLYSTK